MRRSILVLVAILSIFICIATLTPKTGRAANITSAQSGGWSSPSTWVGGVVPAATDNVTIAAGHTVTMDGDFTCTALTINATATLTMNFGLTTTGNVTVNGALNGAGNPFQFNGAATFTNNGAVSNNNFQFNPASATAQNIGGTGTWNVAFLTIVGASTITMQNAITFTVSNTMTLRGTLTLNGHALTFNGNALNVTGGGTDTRTLAVGASTVNFNGANFSNGGTVTGTGLFKAQPSSGNLFVEAGSSFSLALQTISGITTAQGTVGGAITVNSGTELKATDFILSGLSTVTINSGATLSGSNGGALFQFNGAATLTNSGSITVPFLRFLPASPVAQTITGNGTWSGTGSLIVTSNSTVTMSNAMTFAYNTLLTQGAGAFNTGGNTLTLNCNTVDNSGTLNVGAGTVNFNGSAFNNNNTISGSGLIRFQPTGGAVAFFNGSNNFTAALEIVNGITTVSTFGTGISGTLTIDGGAEMKMAAGDGLRGNGNVNINAGAILSGTDANSFFTLNGAALTNNGSITVANFRFREVGGGVFSQTLSGSGSFSNNTAFIRGGDTLTLTSNHQMSAVNIEGTFGGATFDISNRTLGLSGAGTPMANNGVFTTTGSTIVYNGTAAQNAQTINTDWSYSSLTIDNSAGVALGTAESIPGTLSLTNGLFTINSNLTMANGATISRRNGSLSAAPTFGASVNVDYAQTAPVINIPTSFELPVATTVLSNLTVSNTGGVTLSVNATANGSVTINSGASLIVNTPQVLTDNGNATVSGSLSGTGTFDFFGATFTDNSPVTIAAVNFKRNGAQSLTGTGTLAATKPAGSQSFTGNTVTIFSGSNTSLASNHQLNNLIINSGGTMNITNFTLFIAGNLTNNGTFTAGGTSLLNFNGAGNWSSSNAANNFGATTVSSSAVTTLASTITVGAMTVNGTLQTNTRIVQGSGSFTLASGATLGIGDAAGITTSGATGNIQVTGTRTYSAGANFIYNGSVAQATGNGLSQPSSTNDVTINNSAGVTLTASATIGGALNLTSGAFAIGANTLTLNGALSVAAGSLTGGASSNLTVAGAGANLTLPTVASGLNNLIVNRANGVSLSGNNTINGALTLTNGTLAVGTQTLTLNGAVTATGGSLSSAATGTVNYNQAANGQAVLAANYGNLTFSNFNKTLPSSSSVGIAGTFTTGSAIGHTITGSTIDFNGASSQTIPAFAYNNLTSSNSGGRTLQASGVIRIAAIFTPGANSYTITGSTMEYNGAATQTLPAAFATYNNLTINNAAGVSLGGNLTVNGVLTLTSGNASTAANTLTIASSGSLNRTSGHVIGALKKNNLSGSFTFAVGVGSGTNNGYTPLQIANATGGGDLLVRTVAASQPLLDSSQALQEYWMLTATGSVTADLTFNYQQSDVMGLEAAYRVVKVAGSTVTQFQHNPPNVVIDTTANTALVRNINSFSDWTLAAPGAPTEIAFVGLTATPVSNANGQADGALIEWQTGFEVNNLGFNLYREDAGKRTRLNASLIAGSALFAGANTTLTAGRSYSWRDRQAVSATTRYYLEEVDLYGQSQTYGAFFVEAANKVEKSPAAMNDSMLLNELGQVVSSVSASQSTVAETKAMLGNVTLAQQIVQNNLTSARAIKISVKQEGLYRVTQPELIAAGLPPDAEARNLQLFVDGAEIPIAVSTNKDGRFDDTAFIEFYGLGLDTPSTDTRSYWLIVGTQQGKRVHQTKGEGVSSSSTSFTQTIERRDRQIYFAALRNGERENFFASVVSGNPVDLQLDLHHLAADSPQQATLEITLQGVTEQPHRVLVQFNGTTLGELQFTGQENKTVRFTTPHTTLREGANVVRLLAENGNADISLVDAVRLSFQHTFTADHDGLKFTAPDGESLTLAGFSTKAIRLFDVTNAATVSEPLGRIEEQKDGSFAITFTPAERGERDLLAITDNQTRNPAAITEHQPSNLRDTRTAADFLIIAPRYFFPALEPLAQRREREGLRVQVVDIEDIYDEFSFGQKTPQAVKDFLTFAVKYRQLKPRYVMFVGDASYDTKNYLGFGNLDLVPTKLIDTDFLETASDDWFADFDNDGVPEMSLGRLPMRSLDEASNAVSKILGYERTTMPASALLVADSNDAFNFEQASAALRPLLPSKMKVEELARGQLAAETAKARLFAAINRGQTIINYTGHGSLNLWRGNLLTAAEARSLHNDKLPLFVMMNCLNGYFQDAAQDSLSESLLKAERGGAIAVWSSSALTLPEEQAAMNREFYRQLFNEQQTTLGEAIVKAKQAIQNRDIRATWNLLGDPTLRLK